MLTMVKKVIIEKIWICIPAKKHYIYCMQYAFLKSFNPILQGADSGVTLQHRHSGRLGSFWTVSTKARNTVSQNEYGIFGHFSK